MINNIRWWQFWRWKKAALVWSARALESAEKFATVNELFIKRNVEYMQLELEKYNLESEVKRLNYLLTPSRSTSKRQSKI